ncbi:hypothetical protein BH23VER1_BH23VER1_18590 [soil metagenome]
MGDHNRGWIFGERDFRAPAASESPRPNGAERTATAAVTLSFLGFPAQAPPSQAPP